MYKIDTWSYQRIRAVKEKVVIYTIYVNIDPRRIRPRTAIPSDKPGLRPIYLVPRVGNLRASI